MKLEEFVDQFQKLTSEAVDGPKAWHAWVAERARPLADALRSAETADPDWKTMAAVDIETAPEAAAQPSPAQQAVNKAAIDGDAEALTAALGFCEGEELRDCTMPPSGACPLHL